MTRLVKTGHHLKPIPCPFPQTPPSIHFATTAGRIGGFVVPGMLTGLAKL